MPEALVSLSGAPAVAGTPLTLSLEQLKPYEHNPRREPHPGYTALKQSIQARGLEQPLVVTRRPAEAQYVLKAGGNTRLRILQELYRETGDSRFRQAPCTFTPWTSEADVLVSHLLENDRRADLTFIERAWALRRLRALFEQDSGARLSLRALAERLHTVGYYQHPSVLGKMDYALEVLWPAIPTALRLGMGRQTVEALRRLQLAAAQVWSRQGLEGDFTAVFQALLRRYDGEQWDFARLRAAVAYELGVALDTSPSVVGAVLEDLAAGDSHAGRLEPLPLTTPAAVVALGAPVHPTPPTSATGRPPAGAPVLLPRALALARWRRRAGQVAARLAARQGLAAVVRPCPQGGGFVVIDLPPPGTAVDPPGLTTALWWHLADCAAIATAPAEVLRPLLPLGSRLGIQLASRGLEPGSFSALYELDDAAWHDLMRLLELQRAIRQSAAALGLDFWRGDAT